MTKMRFWPVALLPLGLACQKADIAVFEADEGAEPELIADNVDGTAGAKRITLPARLEPLPLSAARAVLVSSFGGAEDQLGSAGDENTESDGMGDPGDVMGPQAIAVLEPQGAAPEILLLDGHKDRYVHIAAEGGRITRSVPLTHPAPDGDIGVDGRGRVHVLSTAPALRHTLYENGALLESLELERPQDGAWPLGIVVSPEGPAWLELSDGRVVTTRGAGGVDGLPGIPVGNELYAYPALIDDDLAAVRFFDAQGILVDEVLFESAVPMAAVSRVALDSSGRLFAVIDRFEAIEDGAAARVEHLIVAVGSSGRLEGAVQVPPTRARSLFRPFAISPSGRIFQLHLEADKARVLEWELGDPPEDVNGPAGGE